MKSYLIEVICHSGYKADEYPKQFTWKGETYTISEIVDRWYEGYQGKGRPATDYFKIKTKYGSEYLLKHLKDSNKWFLSCK